MQDKKELEIKALREMLNEAIDSNKKLQEQISIKDKQLFNAFRLANATFFQLQSESSDVVSSDLIPNLYQQYLYQLNQMEPVVIYQS